MANTIESQVLVNGTRNYIVHYRITGDGSTGDVTNSLVNAVSGDCGTYNAVEEIKVNSSLCSAVLLFDATTKVPFFNIGKDMSVAMDFKKMGQPITNNAGAGVTGNVLITTTGLSTAGAAIDLMLKIRKKPASSNV